MSGLNNPNHKGNLVKIDNNRFKTVSTSVKLIESDFLR